MKHCILILPIFCVNLILTSCSLNRAKSSQMLNYRAGYENQYPVLLKDEHVVPVRKKARRSLVYVYPHEMTSGDHFLGGYIDVLVENEEWIIKPKK